MVKKEQFFFGPGVLKPGPPTDIAGALFGAG